MTNSPTKYRVWLLTGVLFEKKMCFVKFESLKEIRPSLKNASEFFFEYKQYLALEFTQVKP